MLFELWYGKYVIIVFVEVLCGDVFIDIVCCYVCFCYFVFCVCVVFDGVVWSVVVWFFVCDYCGWECGVLDVV